MKVSEENLNKSRTMLVDSGQGPLDVAKMEVVCAAVAGRPPYRRKECCFLDSFFRGRRRLRHFLHHECAKICYTIRRQEEIADYAGSDGSNRQDDV